MLHLWCLPSLLFFFRAYSQVTTRPGRKKGPRVAPHERHGRRTNHRRRQSSSSRLPLAAVRVRHRPKAVWQRRRRGLVFSRSRASSCRARAGASAWSVARAALVLGSSQPPAGRRIRGPRARIWCGAGCAAARGGVCRSGSLRIWQGRRRVCTALRRVARCAREGAVADVGRHGAEGAGVVDLRLPVSGRLVCIGASGSWLRPGTVVVLGRCLAQRGGGRGGCRRGDCVLCSARICLDSKVWRSSGRKSSTDLGSVPATAAPWS
uniref:Secreted protein n=1 Tax=Triticum urartu TaxID=4572 RepID=A0A8R7TW95_TRIUA